MGIAVRKCVSSMHTLPHYSSMALADHRWSWWTRCGLQLENVFYGSTDAYVSNLSLLITGVAVRQAALYGPAKCPRCDANACTCWPDISSSTIVWHPLKCVIVQCCRDRLCLCARPDVWRSVMLGALNIVNRYRQLDITWRNFRLSIKVASC